MAKKTNFKTFVTDNEKYYSVTINVDEKSKGTAQLVFGIIFLFLFFIVGIILLATRKTNAQNYSVHFNINKNNWMDDLNNQIQINNLDDISNDIRTDVIRKINSLSHYMNNAQTIAA